MVNKHVSPEEWEKIRELRVTDMIPLYGIVEYTLRNLRAAKYCNTYENGEETMEILFKTVLLGICNTPFLAGITVGLEKFLK